MTFSLNEIEATAKRAARGAGYSWGVAEEAAKGTRWLCVNGFDGPATLVRLLDLQLALSADHTPNINESAWSGDGVLCPLVTGAYLSDCAGQLAKAPIKIQSISVPLLLLPYAGMVARALNSCVRISMDDLEAVTDGKELCAPGAVPLQADDVTIRLGGVLAMPRSQHARATPDKAAWSKLNDYAHRTYAPATDQSRLLGAGAGLSDND